MNDSLIFLAVSIAMIFVAGVIEALLIA